MSAMPAALQKFLDEANAKKTEITVASARKNLAIIADICAQPKLGLSLIQNYTFHTANHSIITRIYHPQPEKKLPLTLYFHGGGHVSGSLDTHDALCRRIAASSECVVLSVGYRLAPEFPYPAGIEDCRHVFVHRGELEKFLNIDNTLVFLAGDSAGGNLALTVAHTMKTHGDTCIKGLVLIYPSVDYTMQYPSIDRYGEGYLLDKEKIAWYFNQYFSQKQDRLEASPLYFRHLEKLPPFYLAVGEYDPLHDEGVAFAKKVQSLGVSVELEEFAGMVHVFAQLETIVPNQGNRLIQSIGNFIKKTTFNRLNGFN